MIKQNNLYLGEIRNSYIGYATDDSVRNKAASGGFVTAFLTYLLKSGTIDGALVCRAKVEGGRLVAYSYVASSEEELKEAQTSVYMDFPYFEAFKSKIASYSKLAVVALPCQINTITKMAESDPVLAKKIFLKLSLYCSHASEPSLINNLISVRHKINLNEVSRFYFKKGHWRGYTIYEMHDGRIIEKPYLGAFGLYMNLYYYMKTRCLSCDDQTCRKSDISCGDAWLRRLKTHSIKYSMINIRTEIAEEYFDRFLSSGRFKAEQINEKEVIQSQKRGLIRKVHYVYPFKVLGPLFGFKTNYKGNNYARWNHWIGASLLLINIKLSRYPRIMSIILRIPKPILYVYVAIIKFFMNF
jgi:coenzyme F420-reducing hydrogenase beta subunit